jgi:hypothetical protein
MRPLLSEALLSEALLSEALFSEGLFPEGLVGAAPGGTPAGETVRQANVYRRAGVHHAPGMGQFLGFAIPMRLGGEVKPATVEDKSALAERGGGSRLRRGDDKVAREGRYRDRGRPPGR